MKRAGEMKKGKSKFGRRDVGRTIQIRRVLAFVMTFIIGCMTFLADMPAMVFAEEPMEIENDDWQLSVMINGVDISSVTSISKGDALSVKLSCNMREGIYNCPTTFSKDLNAMKNVTMPNVADIPVQFGGRVVGTASITGGRVTIKLTDSTFLTMENGRTVMAELSGSINDLSATNNSGDMVPIQIAGISKTIKWDNGEEEIGLGSNKSLDTFEMQSDGSGRQYYTIRISGYQKNPATNPAHGVPSADIYATIGSVTDTAGASLQNAAGFTIMENTTTDNGGSCAIGTNIGSLDTLTGLKFHNNEYITVRYYMEVPQAAVEAYLANGQNTNDLKNTIAVSYQTNKQNPGNTGSDVYGLNANRIQVSKSLSSGATDELQTWTLTVNVGDSYVSTKTNLSDYISSVEEIPGTGLVAANGSTLTLDSFTHQGSGVFTATYQTSLTEEFKNGESANVTNRFTVTPIGSTTPIEASANYQTTGVPGTTSVAKTVIGYEEASRLISWDVTVKDLPVGATNVKVQDFIPYYVTSDQGEHKVQPTVYVDGVLVVENGVITSSGSSVISGVENGDGRSYAVQLQDSYVQSHAGDITVRFCSKIPESVISLKDYTFYNDGILNYTTALGATKSLSSRASYHNEAAAGDALSKSGSVNASDPYQADYVLKMDVMNMPYVNSADGESIIITDVLPEGMKYVDGSLQFQDSLVFGSNVYYDSLGFYRNNGDGTYAYDRWYLSGGTPIPKTTDAVTTVSYNDTTHILTITIPVDEEFMIRKNAIASYGGKYVLEMYYSAQIADENAFVRTGETKNFVNTATGTYDGTNLNAVPAISSVSIAPEALVDKTGNVGSFSLDGANFNSGHYEIDINPFARDLASESNWLMATDTLAYGLSYCLDTVKVYEIENGTETLLVNGKSEGQYYFDYDDKTNSLTFYLPDAKHLKITYDAFVNIYDGYHTGHTGDSEKDSFSEANSKNSFALYGCNQTNASDSVYFSGITTDYSVSATSDTGSITVDKYCTIDGVMNAVSGTQFEIWQMRLEGGNYVKDTLHGTYTITNTTGKLSVSNLGFNVVYGLYEIAPGTPVGISGHTLACREEPYLFVIPGTANNPLPAGVRQFSSGSYLYLENEETTAATMSIAKVDSSNNLLAGAHLELYDGTTFVAAWDSTSTPKTIQVVDSGNASQDASGNITLVAGRQYTLKETVVPSGYCIAEDISFTPTITGSTVTITINSGSGTVVGSQLRMTDAAVADLTVSKVASGGGVELPGATFRFYDADGIADRNSIPADTVPLETWVGTTTPHVISGTNLKTDHYYILTETAAPSGYQRLTTNIVIYIQSNGTAMLVSASATGSTPASMVYTDVALNAGKITITNQPLQTMEISKQAVGGSSELSGAVLYLYKYNGAYNPSVYTTPIAAWISGTTAKTIKIDTSMANGTYMVQGGEIILAPGNYVLHEQTAPSGFAKAEQVYFEIKADGSIGALDASGTSISPVSGTNGEVDGRKLIMRDAPYQNIYVNKLILGTSLPAEGAEITIYEYDTISTLDFNGVIAQKETLAYVDRFTTSSSAYLVSNKLVAGTKYAIVETAAPADAGLKQLEGIYVFTIEDTGVISSDASGSTWDANEIVLGTTGSGGITNTIIMKDEVQETTISIAKRIMGTDTPLSGAKFELYAGDTATGTALASWTTNDAPRQITIASSQEISPYDNPTTFRIVPGVYTIKETAPPANYDILEETITFSVDATGKITLQGSYASNAVAIVQNIGSGDSLNIYNEPRPAAVRFTISKQALGGTTELADAGFELYEVTGDAGNYQIAASPLYTWDSGITAKSFGIVSVGTNPLPDNCVWDGSIYALKEVSAPTGYDLNDSIVIFKVENNGGTGKITILQGGSTLVEGDGTNHLIFRNRPYRSIEVCKTDLDTGAMLNGASLSVYRLKSDVTYDTVADVQNPAKGAILVHNWNSVSSGAETITNLAVGETYALLENSAPANYSRVDTLVKFTVAADGTITLSSGTTAAEVTNSTTLSNNRILFKNDFASQTIDISKRAINGSDELPGAKLQLLRGGTVIATWISTDSSKTVTIDVKDQIVNDASGNATNITITPGDYELREITAPAGYATAESIPFTVAADGTISLRSSNGEISAETKTLIMRDAPYKEIVVSKTGLGGTEVAGAQMAVYLASDITGITDVTHIPGSVTPLVSWTSNAASPYYIQDVLVAGTTYALVEKVAPSNYQQITTVIKFTISASGEVQLLGTYENISGGNVLTENNNIKLSDHLVTRTIQIGKREIAGGPEIPGAKLELYNGAIAGGTPIAYWMSSNQVRSIQVGSTQRIVTNSNGEAVMICIKPGTYTLHEAGAPNGYAYTSDITFQVSETGTITLSGSPANAALINGGSGFVMLDQALALSISKQDTDTSTELAGAHLQLWNYEAGHTTSLVAEWSTGTVFHVNPSRLQAGKQYALIENLAPAGYARMTTPILFTVKTDGTLEINSGTAGSYAQSGNQITVYNTPANDTGRLVIQKTIAGPVTEAEVLGALVFQIENNTTHATETFTLAQFDHAAGTYTYTLALTEEAANYTITEFVTDITGKTLISTTYSVGGAAYTEGVTSVASVTAGNDTVVQYRNVYVDTSVPVVPDTPTEETSKGDDTITETRNVMTISKQAIAGSMEVPGATLSLYEGSRATGEPVFTWVSGTTPRAIAIGESTVVNGSSVTLKPGTYTLQETGAPAGYAYAEAITFRVDGNGRITLANPDNGEISPSGTLIMRDEAIRVSISKVDLVNGAELAGAVLTLYQRITDETGNETLVAVESWISDGQTHLVEAPLRAGAEYVIKEIAAPEGYDLLETTILFRVENNGSVTLVGAYDNNEVQISGYGDGNSSNQIIVKNAVSSGIDTGDRDTDVDSDISTNVRTGDTSQTLLWCGLLLLGIALFAISFVNLRRRLQVRRGNTHRKP
ncbi:MAG: collagen binding domain-containing protein [Lachnospiraceae bacterium]